jgi:FkbM family methyltransferase
MTQDGNSFDAARVNLEEIYAKKEFGLLLYRLQNLPPDSRARLQGKFTQVLEEETLAVETPFGPLSFVVLGRNAGCRALSLLTKQPGTIEWINTFRPESVFWDVGANVGVYSLYAALRGETNVVAFEPAAVNYFLLAANCEVNRLDSRVDCLLVGLGSHKAVARLEVSQFAAARSFSFHGKRDQPHGGRQAALVLSMDQLIEEYGLACPNYIKIDVPGVTEDIIAGGVRMLQRPDVRELHIEFSEQSRNGRWITQTLEQHGFAATNRHTHGGSTDVTFVRRSTPTSESPPST